MSTCFSWISVSPNPFPFRFCITVGQGGICWASERQKKSNGLYSWKVVVIKYSITQDAEMSCRSPLVLCSMYLACASDCGLRQPIAAAGPPWDISLGTHRAGSYKQTTAFHRSLHKFLPRALISMAGRTRLLRFPGKFWLIHCASASSGLGNDFFPWSFCFLFHTFISPALPTFV